MLLLSFWLLLIVFSLQQLQVQPQPVDRPMPLAETLDNEVGRAVYDQRQTGKYNIHVSIKDVAIIEVDQNELADESYNAEDDDYYYDDSALTIKPIKFTTEGSTTTTIATTQATTRAATTPKPSTIVAPTTVAVAAASSNNMSAYSAQLLADIAATQHQHQQQLHHHQKPKTNNLIIMDSSSTLLPKWLQARSKDEPITTTTTTTRTTTAMPLMLRPQHTDSIEYTPAQGHDSPIFKVKVQRAASSNPAESPAHCRTNQYRDAQGKCRSKRTGSILRKLFGMLVSLPFAGQRRAHHGHGLQVSP